MLSAFAQAVMKMNYISCKMSAFSLNSVNLTTYGGSANFTELLYSNWWLDGSYFLAADSVVQTMKYQLKGILFTMSPKNLFGNQISILTSEAVGA